MDIQEQLKRDEGVRREAYLDEEGNWTIGVGHLIGPSEMWMTKPGVQLTDQQVDTIFAHDLAELEAELSRIPWYGGLDDARRGAMLNMAFNLGVPKLLHFPTMIHYLSLDEFEAAASAALDSEWANQEHYDAAQPLESRPGRVAEQIRTGVWV